MRTVYLDNAATTKVDPRVLEAMLPYFTEDYGNASSIHGLGRKTNVAVEQAREKIAHYLHTKSANIVFTSGGTEGNNAVIKGVLHATAKKEIISSPVEHQAVLHPLERAESEGYKVLFTDVAPDGKTNPEQLKDIITDDTALVTLMHVNNEIGTINDVKEIAEVCHQKGVPFHSDTVQSAGKVPVNIEEAGFDFMNISAHKFHGPKGVGAMFVNPDIDWQPWLEGGSQERRRRGGTLNVPGIVGMAKALEIACEEMNQNIEHIAGVKKKLVTGLRNAFGDDIAFNGPVDEGIHNIINISFPIEGSRALDGEMLLLNLDIEGICCSNGSACTSGAVEASHVLTALGLGSPSAKSSVRFSLSKFTTAEDVDYTIEKLVKVVTRMKQSLN